jgi:transposase
MTAILQGNHNAPGQVLYMALELSNTKWKLGFSNGDKQRQVTIEAGDLAALAGQITQAKEKLKLPKDGPVRSCYEAGRDGFWIHRHLIEQGIDNAVIDSASIEVNRRQRRAKTDSVDVQALLKLLIRHGSGEPKVMSIVRVPSVEDEDRRRLHRERERLLKERGAHSARIKSLLIVHGIRLEIRSDFLEQLNGLHSATGYPLGDELKAELQREYRRYHLVAEQVKLLEQAQQQRAEQACTGAMAQIKRLMQLKGVGWQSSWILTMELFGWRTFKNQRELGACAGLTPMPYSSGASEREQGISKAGNRRIRSLMVELSWLWLKYQPDSTLSQGYQQRHASGGKRMRRIGIVAMARKLLIALWRYLTDGVVPEGAVFKAI